MNVTDPKRLLLIGIGNDSRGDDGLGWKFASEMETAFPEMNVAYRYQLQIEDAEFISGFDTVVFVDSTREALPNGFSWTRCEPLADVSFSTHRQPPGTIVYLARELFGSGVNAFVLAISGQDWGLHEGLSTEASHNLTLALAFAGSQMLPAEAIQPIL